MSENGRSGTVMSDHVLNLHEAISIAIIDHKEKIENPEIKMAINYFVGPPGSGKTESLRELAKKQNFHLIVRNAGFLKVEELGGIPDFLHIESEEGKRKEMHTIWSIPDIICEARELSKEKPVLIVIDDWHLASKSVQSVGFEAFTDYTIRGKGFPADTLIMLAGNDKALSGSKPQFGAVMNRVAKYYIKPSYKNWRDKFAFKNEVYGPIISFLEDMSNREFFQGEESMVDPWPSPRSWTYLSTKIQALQKRDMWKKLSGSTQSSIYAAYVGHEAAAKFKIYTDIYSQFDTKAIFATGQFDIPVKSVERFAFIYAVTDAYYSHYYSTDNEKERVYYSKIYVDILNKIHKSNKELMICSIKYVHGKGKGHDLIKTLASKNILPLKKLAEFMKTSGILGEVK